MDETVTMETMFPEIQEMEQELSFIVQTVAKLPHDIPVIDGISTLCEDLKESFQLL